MRALFGVVSLLVALAIVGFIVAKQLKATAPAGLTASPSDATVREASQAVQQKVQDDITKALEQAAAARAEQVEK